MGTITSGERIDFAGIEAVLRGAVTDNAIVREPLKCSLSNSDLKRVLVRIGEAKCVPRKFVIDDDNRFTYENLFKWVTGDESLKSINPISGEVEQGSLTKGIYICGPTGTGKTMCLNIFRTFIDAIGAMVTIKGRGRYCLAWTTYFATDVSQMMQDYGTVSLLVNDYPVLCIQDIGSEVQTVSHFGTKSNAVEQIIQMRGEQNLNLITVLSSNYRIKGIPYGSRIESRLCQMCNYYEIKGTDRRMG